ncbi:MAG: hypothetical protein FD143_2704 [Ignavibacteria bacterium]|nr:MAG: hypothetical protein FD143_2704 [Ignavibacteria bacterium]KAF0157782.1 MAG: hypothetical protein FD188_2660 [Ignavibacteria bacterium]
MFLELPLTEEAQSFLARTAIFAGVAEKLLTSLHVSPQMVWLRSTRVRLALHANVENVRNYRAKYLHRI